MIEKKLIVCADDFGLTEGVNEGIVDAYRKGIVTRTSIIANGRAFDHAVLSAKKNEGLKVGIHLTLVEEVPVDQRKKNNSLTGPNGKFPLDYKAFLVRYIYRKINPNEVYLEWESQIRKALGSGLEINHIDSHQHLHMLPGVFRIALELADKYKIKKIRMLHCDITSVRRLKELVLTFLSDINKRRITCTEIGYADNFWGLKQSGHIRTDDVLQLADNIKNGTTEMMCHPGYADNMYYQKYGHWNYRPEEELKALTSDRVKAKLKDKNIKLVS